MTPAQRNRLTKLMNEITTMQRMADMLFNLLCAGIVIAGLALVIYWPLSALGILDMINIESHR